MLRALALVIALAPLAGAQELTVQTTWRLAAVGLDADPGLDAQRLLRRVERGLRRELPGLEVTFDVGAWRSLRRPEGARPPASERATVREGLRLAEAAGVDVASYDVVFVLAPYGERYFGLSHIDARDALGRPARGALIHSAPFDLLHQGVLRALEGRSPPGFQPPTQALPPALGQLLAQLLRWLEEPLRALCQLPWIREALLEPTLAHELGHFFAPGDRDIRDGYQRPWLRHATGPDDNPEGHGLECVMYKGRDASFYLRKLVAIRGRTVVFCDPCREKLGLSR